MTIDELIERLQASREEFSGDTEVRLMTQENWPFENTIAGTTSAAEILRASGEPDEEDEDFDPEGDEEDVVYIVEGRQLGYGDKRAWNVCQ